MNPYTKNPACSCSRCRAGRLLLPALIITVGVLFLLHANGAMDIDRSWPVAFLVAGLFLFLSSSASIEGHVQPQSSLPMAQPDYATQSVAQQGVAPTSPTQPQTNDPASGPGTSTHNDSQVNS